MEFKHLRTSLRIKEIIKTRTNNIRSCNAMLLISCHQYQQHVIVQQEVANYKVITIPSSWCLAWVAKHQTGDIINESYNNYYSYHSWKPPRVTSLSLRSNAQLLITSLLLLDYVIWEKFYCFLACLWQKAFILPKPSSRAEGSTAKVMRNQFFIPRATPKNETRVLLESIGSIIN